MTDPKQILFLTGASRSGTAALARILNTHPALCLGIERYKVRFLRKGLFSGDEFTRERFFRFEQGDTNTVPDAKAEWKTLYAEMEPKFEKAQIVGDRIPQLVEQFDACAAAFPQAKWIYMLRRIEAVAASWNARAMNPDDTWPADKDHRRAVETWNRENAMIRAHLGRRVHVVCYEDFFGGNSVAVKALIRFLGLGAPRPFQAHLAAARRHYAETVLDRSPTPMESQAEYIARTADFATYRHLVRASGCG